MTRWLALVGAVVASACARDTAPVGTGARHETVVAGLIVPWSIAFAPDGRVFVTERPGRIRVLSDWRLAPQPWATLDVANAGEAGLMGIAVSPNFAQDGNVFVVATFRFGEELVSRVIRFTEHEGRGSEPTVIVDGIPGSELHTGATLAFGPDGMLYVATGDARNPASARDPRSLAGKVLRVSPDGRIPADNPFPGSPLYALGVRNVQGLAWTPDGQLLATDHGPSGFPDERFRRNHDELNVIMPGRDYGWPAVAGRSDDPSFAQPVIDWTPTIAPSGIAVYNGPHEPWKSSVFVGALRGHLRRVHFEGAQRRRVRTEEILFPQELGRIRAVVMAPDGFIYFATSNWDGRGQPGPRDDRILRLRPH